MPFQALLDSNGPFGLTWFQWLGLLAVVTGAILFGYIAGRLVRAVLGRLVRRTRSNWDDTLLDRLAGPLGFALGLALSAALVPFVNLPAEAGGTAYRVIRVGYFVVFYWALFRLVDVGFHVLSESMWARSGSSRSLIPLGSRVAKVGIFAIAAVAVLSYLGYPVASLVAGLGIGGLALALAAQKTVENLFGAFSIGVDQPFRVGDFVKIDDFLATVERIGLRSTRFRTLDRTLVTIPNGQLADSRIESYSARDRMRLWTMVGIEYGSTESQVREVLEGFKRVLRDQPKLWPETVVVLLRGLGASSLDIEVMAWFQTEDFGEFQAIRQEVLLQFLGVVERAGTAVAFPTQTLHLASPIAVRSEGNGPPTSREMSATSHRQPS
jgi:MscS family membrane protein